MYKVINPLEYGILIEPLFGPVLEGIFKHKYWDFYVKEIDMDGNVMSLTDISCPSSVKANNFEADFTNIHTELKKNIDEFSKSKSNSLVIPAQSMNIENEQLIHTYINKFYTNIRFKSKKSSNILLTRRKPSSKVHRKIIDTWPSHISNFTSFILFKENLSTTDALRILAKKVNVHFSQFSVCGMKDKRSISVQKVCVIKVDPFQLYRSFYPNDIIIKENTDLLIGNINLCCNRLRHGELKGNYFEIVIREINILKENHKNIDNILRDLFKKMEPFGFPNFFGKQRFGLGDVSNYLIGKDIILCDWKSAVNGILCERPKMDNSIRGAIQEWKRSGNSSLALQFIENDLNKKMEVNILRKININNNKIDVHCLDRVPYSIQTMYLHAFQSYIWNQILSLRLEVKIRNLLRNILLKYWLGI
uniref:Pseudouridylate synthase 7 homolog (Trinotate prediction) n=1 Tax=Henneguya salminicola TaxID=69463 RepID=A0A6G3MDV0_HENSL